MFLSDVREDTRIFIDANIFVYHFSANSRFNPSCTAFFERVEAGVVHGITCASVVQEVVHRVMVEEALLSFPDVKPKDIIKYLKEHRDKVKSLAINQQIPAKITLLNVEVIPLDIKLIQRSQSVKGEHGFLSNDALIVQIMRDHDIAHLASNDSDFEQAEGIILYRPSVASENRPPTEL